MRTRRELYSEKEIVYESEWDACPEFSVGMVKSVGSLWKFNLLPPKILN